MRSSFIITSVLACASAVLAAPQACPNALVSSVAAPKVAKGHDAALIVTGLSRPRTILFDSAGHLLVLQSGSGVVALTLADGGGKCVSSPSRSTVIADNQLNHGMVLSLDGKTLFVSSAQSVFAYAYNAQTATVTLPGKEIITNMSNSDHVTRTLLISQKQPGTLVVTRGSADNIDSVALDINSGHCQVKAFDIDPLPSSPVDFTTGGKLLGWGLRNLVGIAEHPTTGGIYSVENSADQLTRNGVNFAPNNPAEKLNYHGTLVNNVSPNQGKFFGYPACFAAWAAKQVPGAPTSLKTGQQFALNPRDAKYTDAYCASSAVVAPSMAFRAHTAPLDIKFTADGNTAYISFHGSWNRVDPVGYKIGTLEFRNGVPVAKPGQSKKALRNLVRNADTGACPGGCFRPVGLALGSNGRVLFSSDATGEIYIIVPT